MKNSSLRKVKNQIMHHDKLEMDLDSFKQWFSTMLESQNL